MLFQGTRRARQGRHPAARDGALKPAMHLMQERHAASKRRERHAPRPPPSPTHLRVCAPIGAFIGEQRLHWPDTGVAVRADALDLEAGAAAVLLEALDQRVGRAQARDQVEGPGAAVWTMLVGAVNTWQWASMAGASPMHVVWLHASCGPMHGLPLHHRQHGVRMRLQHAAGTRSQKPTRAWGRCRRSRSCRC